MASLLFFGFFQSSTAMRP